MLQREWREVGIRARCLGWPGQMEVWAESPLSRSLGQSQGLARGGLQVYWGLEAVCPTHSRKAVSLFSSMYSVGLKGRVREKEGVGGRERGPEATARSESIDIWNQQLHLVFHEGAVVQALGPSLLFSPAVSRWLDQKWSRQDPYWHSYGMLALIMAHLPPCHNTNPMCLAQSPWKLFLHPLPPPCPQESPLKAVSDPRLPSTTVSSP